METKKRRKQYYLAVTDDSYEYPVCVAESYKELAEFLGVSVFVVKQAYYRNSVNKCSGIRLIRVPDEDENNIYQQKGFADRKDYLNWLAFKYEVSKETVNVFANMYGENEDFNKLIVMLENISKTK